MIIIMLGAPASGKGSVAEILSNKYDIPAISTGDIFRKNIAEKTELGEKAQTYMNKGLLVPDDITVNMITSRLKEPDVKNGVILDGFPRTVNQAELLDKIFDLFCEIISDFKKLLLLLEFKFELLISICSILIIGLFKLIGL